MTRPELADLLGLDPHPEGGWYRRVWTSPVEVTLLDGRVRPTATVIHFLLPAGETSTWHRVASDEIWLAQRGTVTLQHGDSGAQPRPGRRELLGPDPASGASLQVTVPAGQWQRTLPGDHDALVSCLVSPGFDFDDLELAGSWGSGPRGSSA